jgi:hypothetical protein
VVASMAPSMLAKVGFHTGWTYEHNHPTQQEGSPSLTLRALAVLKREARVAGCTRGGRVGGARRTVGGRAGCGSGLRDVG